MFEFDTPVAVPDKCKGCAVQGGRVSSLILLLLLKHGGEQLGTAFMGPAGEELDAILEASFPEEDASALKQTTRKIVADRLTTIDEKIETTEQAIAANELSCSGILKMRATKEGVTYTVNVCTSPHLYVLNSGQPESVATNIIATTPKA